MLVAVWNEEDRAASNEIAGRLRARGIATDVAPTAAKLGKQIKYADKLGIPYVWFPADRSDPEAVDEVKNIVTGRPGTGRCQVVGAGYAGCPANRGDSRSGSSMSQTGLQNTSRHRSH